MIVVSVSDVEIGTVFPNEVFVGGEVEVYWSVYLDKDVDVSTPVSVVVAVNSKDNVIYDKEVYVTKGHHFVNGSFKLRFTQPGRYAVMVGAKVISVPPPGGGAPPRTPIRMFSIMAYEGYVWSKPVYVTVKEVAPPRKPTPREPITRPEPKQPPSRKQPIYRPVKETRPSPQPTPSQPTMIASMNMKNIALMGIAVAVIATGIYLIAKK